MAVVPASMNRHRLPCQRDFRQPAPSRRRRMPEGTQAPRPGAARNAAAQHSSRKHAHSQQDGSRCFFRRTGFLFESQISGGYSRLRGEQDPGGLGG
ncbi:hypothetical protein GBAR_LOCUS28087 [Geodia barretti]|uniref:Uncharacterized protein n=1 Tax=Geodia barretti TaxID=519541 RepID=A0AA35XHR5_GEOBA|nr:hypothetical protein GBAR_LOCUS28087 [Geodia barretti]